MGKKALTKGELYEIIFKDHSMGPKECPIVRAVGYLIADNSDNYHFSCWCLCTDDIEFFNDNLESFHILKSTIIKVKKLCKIPMKSLS